MRTHPAETMKKILFMILSVCLAAACLTGCGKKSKFALGQYKGLKYTAQTFEVTDEEIENYVLVLQNQYLTYETLKDRENTEVKSGDIVNIDYQGILEGQTEPFQGGTAAGTHLEIGSGRFIAGFEEGLIGKKPGQAVVLNLTFPEQYYEDLAGKNVKFTVTINAIEKAVVPPATDEMVEDYTEGMFKTLQEYRDYTREYLLKKKQDNFKSTLKEELLQQVVASTKFDTLDEKKLNEYYTTLVNYYAALASSKGISIDTLISATGKSSDEFYAELKAISEKTMKEELVLNEIISKENITLTDEMYNSMISEYMERYEYEDRAKFESDYTVEKIRRSMLFDLALKVILDNAVAE